MRNDVSDIKTRGFGRRFLYILFIFFGAMIFLSFLLLSVWMPSKAVRIAYDIELLAQEKERLELENERLSIEVASLKDPERIEKIATDELKMVRSLEIEVEIIKK